MPNSFRASDDYSHIPGKDINWRESYYFNFVDHNRKASGFTTIGVLPNQQKAEFILALFYDDKQNVYYKDQQIPTKSQTSTIFTNKTLTYQIIEPMKKWKITLSEENLSLQFQWRARFPPVYFGKGSGTSWRRHFEQSGIVTGEANLSNGRRIQVEGFSQRDKSWGPRNWHIEKWFALHAQFQKQVICLRKDTVSSLSSVCGGLSSAKKQLAANQVDVEIEYGKDDPKTPKGALTTVYYSNGEVDKLRSWLISPKSFAKFSRSFPKGSTELFEGMVIHERITTGEIGTGLIEFLFTYPKP